jgi:hypothetical protein
MSDEQATPFGSRVAILSDLWIGYRFDDEFEDFVSYNDIGLPLAYAMDNKIIDDKQTQAIAFINETWDLFITSLGIEDTGFESLEEMLDSVAE